MKYTTPTKLWIFVILLLIGHLILQYLFYLKVDLTTTSGKISFLTDLFSNLALIILLGVALGALAALIPFRQKRYWDKFRTTLPLLTLIILWILVSFFSFVIFFWHHHGFVKRSIYKYENIKQPGNLDCSSLRNGVFEYGEYIFERTDTIQIETEVKTGIKHEFKIHWTNDCEYVLIPVLDSLLKMKVKITSVSTNSYDCYVGADKFANRPALFFTIKRKAKKPGK